MIDKSRNSVVGPSATEVPAQKNAQSLLLINEEISYYEDDPDISPRTKKKIER
jgi:hypothetical protein